MPDAALRSTERQIRGLLERSCGELRFNLRVYIIPEVPRSESGRELARNYQDIGELWHTALDGLIVTGTEPRTDDLREEPYLGHADSTDGLGRRTHGVDRLVLPRGPRGAAAHGWRRAAAPHTEAVRRVRVHAGRRIMSSRKGCRSASGCRTRDGTSWRWRISLRPDIPS